MDFKIIVTEEVSHPELPERSGREGEFLPRRLRRNRNKHLGLARLRRNGVVTVRGGWIGVGGLRRKRRDARFHLGTVSQPDSSSRAI